MIHIKKFIIMGLIVIPIIACKKEIVTPTVPKKENTTEQTQDKEIEIKGIVKDFNEPATRVPDEAETVVSWTITPVEYTDIFKVVSKDGNRTVYRGPESTIQNTADSYPFRLEGEITATSKINGEIFSNNNYHFSKEESIDKDIILRDKAVKLLGQREYNRYFINLDFSTKFKGEETGGLVVTITSEGTTKTYPVPTSSHKIEGVIYARQMPQVSFTYGANYTVDNAGAVQRDRPGVDGFNRSYNITMSDDKIQVYEGGEEAIYKVSFNKKDLNLTIHNIYKHYSTWLGNRSWYASKDPYRSGELNKLKEQLNNIENYVNIDIIKNNIKSTSHNEIINIRFNLLYKEKRKRTTRDIPHINPLTNKKSTDNPNFHCFFYQNIASNHKFLKKRTSEKDNPCYDIERHIYDTLPSEISNDEWEQEWLGNGNGMFRYMSYVREGFIITLSYKIKIENIIDISNNYEVFKQSWWDDEYIRVDFNNSKEIFLWGESEVYIKLVKKRRYI